jgi:hypothetical protein
MTQVLVKTTPWMQGSYSYDVPWDQVRAFTSRPDVWWYTVPEDDDYLDWHRGGAWDIAAMRSGTPGDLSGARAQEYEGAGQSAYEDQRSYAGHPTDETQSGYARPAAQDEEDEDERW